MKNMTLVVAMTVPLLVVSAASAVEEHHPDQKPTASAPATPKDAKAKEAKDGGMPMGMMQDRMLKMHEQMHKIMQAKDPKERDKLMQEHMQMMQEHMKMMGGMMGQGMTGGDGKGGMMGAPAGK